MLAELVKNVIARTANVNANVANEGNAPVNENVNVAAIVTNRSYIIKKLTINNHEDYQSLTSRIITIPNHG